MQELKKLPGLVYAGMSIAICLAATFVLVPGPNGAMIHLGSAAIYTLGIVLGRRYAAVGGAFGSMIFDVLAGFSPYTLFSFVIKGISGYIVGYFGVPSGGVPSRGRILIATLIASLWTLLGYVLAWWFVIGSLTVAIANIPFSLMTSAVGILVAELLAPRLYELIHR